MSFPDSLKPIRLHYHRYVPENYDPKLAPIIFIHGLSCTQATWFTIKPIIAEKTKRQVYAVDIRNHGKSEWTEVFNLDSLVADVVHFMDEEDIEQSILVGHSMGGMIAACLAALKPNRVEKLIVEDQKLSFTNEDSDRLKAMLKAVIQIHPIPKSFTEKQAQQLVEKFFKYYFPKQADVQCFIIYKDKNGEFKLNFYIEPLLKSIEDRVLIFPDFEKYKEYTGPTLFLYGGQSEMQVYEDEQIPKVFPNVQFMKIEKGYHMLHFEFPDKFVEIVSGYINS